MAKAIELIGWFVFNVAIPLLAPLALLPMAKLPYFYRDRSRGIVRRAVENGQLLWSAIPSIRVPAISWHRGWNKASATGNGYGCS